MYVVDCGTNKATIYNSETDETKIISLIDVLNLPSNLPSGSLVVAESAHLGSPRTKLSRSQPFTEDLLLDLYQRFDDAGITLKLFPQQSTPNACSYSGLKKSDLNDPKSIYLYIDGHLNISLKNPPKSFEPNAKRLASYDYKRQTDAYINVARREDNAYAKDKCSMWIMQNIENIASALTEEEKFWFGLTDDNRYKKKSSKFNFKNGVRMNGLFAIICTILDDEGKIRIRPETGNMPGWQYVKQYILRMTPFHHKGGVARSNLYWHIFRNQLISKGKNFDFDFDRKVKSLDGKDDRTLRRGHFNELEEKFFLEQRKEFLNTIRKIWQVSRDLLNSDPNIEKQDLMDYSEQSEFTFSSCSH